MVQVGWLAGLAHVVTAQSAMSNQTLIKQLYLRSENAEPSQVTFEGTMQLTHWDGLFLS